MNVTLSRFDITSLADLSKIDFKGSGNECGWIGSVNRENDDSCKAFIAALMKGDIESAKRFQEFDSRMLFSIACVSNVEVTILLFQYTGEPVAPFLLENWTFKNEGVCVVDSKNADAHEKLLCNTSLTWKESFAAILRSFFRN